jgi:hypothetical protein
MRVHVITYRGVRYFNCIQFLKACGEYCTAGIWRCVSSCADAPFLSIKDIRSEHYELLLICTRHMPCMLLLDPCCRWNITEVSRLGVKSVYCPRGLTSAVWQERLSMFEDGAAAAGDDSKKQKHKQKKADSRVYG